MSCHPRGGSPPQKTRPARRGKDQQLQVAKAQAEFDFQQVQQDLILRSGQAYFDLLDASDSLTFARAEKKAIGQQLNQTRQRFNVGLTAITDVHEAQARYDQSVANEIQADNTLAIAKEALRELMGKAPGALALLSEKMPLAVPEPEDIAAWVQHAQDRNLTLLSTQKAVEAARASISIARGGHVPTLDLIASHDYTDSSGSIFSEKSTETSVGVKLNVPLFSGGAVSSATRQATYAHQAALENLEQVRRATERQARNAYLTVVASISSVKALKQALASSSTALEATRAGFEVGTRTAVDVLDSQQALYLARRNYARARYNYIIETFRLKQAAGSLSENDLKQVNRWLE